MSNRPHLSSQYIPREDHYHFTRNTGLPKESFDKEKGMFGKIVVAIILFATLTLIVYTAARVALGV